MKTNKDMLDRKVCTSSVACQGKLPIMIFKHGADVILRIVKVYPGDRSCCKSFRI